MTAQRLIAAGFPPERVAIKAMVPANLRQFLEIGRPAAPRKVARLLFVGRFCAQKNLSLARRRERGARTDESAFELILSVKGSGTGLARSSTAGSREVRLFPRASPREELPASSPADIFVLSSATRAIRAS